MERTRKNLLLCVLTVLGVVLLDQLTKLWVLDAVSQKGVATDELLDYSVDLFRLIPNVLHFSYLTNDGAAFGMLSDHRWVFMVLSTAAIVVMLLYIFIARPKNVWETVSLSMIVGGGIGNMIDRVMRGFVVDFIDVTCIDFYVFNVADSFVCVGCALLVLTVFLSERAAAKEKKHAE